MQCLLHAVTKAETVTVPSHLHSTFLVWVLCSVSKQILQDTELPPKLGHWEHTQTVQHNSIATGRTQEAPSSRLAPMLPNPCKGKQCFRSAPLWYLQSFPKKKN